MVHITNGAATGAQLRIFAPSATVLEWGDVLHEGPVPEGISFSELNLIRSTFLAGQGWGDAREILRTLNARQVVLESDSEFTLWFEEDLSDQLQILQILNWFNLHTPQRLALVWVPQAVRAADLGAFLAARRTVRPEMLVAGAACWQAFCSATPKLLLRVLKTSSPALPHLSKSLVRFLQEYPSKRNGLSRKERQILEVLAAGPLTAHQVFVTCQTLEESIYMGDAPFGTYLDRLAPLLENFASGTLTGKISLAPLAHDVLAGKVDWIRHNGIDRWLGGTHLKGNAVGWRWDDVTRSLAVSTS